MKLLFDHNLSPSLVVRLGDLFPESEHVFHLGLDHASDFEIRDYARRNEFTIVTKDADFSDLCVLHGFPPKIVWIRRGNCSFRAVEQLLRNYREEIKSLDGDLMERCTDPVLSLRRDLDQRKEVAIDAFD
jgi:predicted nuclease of predicted toxin-antitoxin system